MCILVGLWFPLLANNSPWVDRFSMLIDQFKKDLKELSSTQIFRKHLLSSGCFALDDHQYFKLREEVSEFFSVEFNDTILVGSGRLGFSIKPTKRFVSFNDDSDLDLAIVSPKLFEKIWQDAFLYKRSAEFWPNSRIFFRYLAEGWIRPDKLPPSEYFKFSKEWWDFFNKITNGRQFGPYKIRAGLYYSHFFLQEYQTICIEQCMQEV
ncbi:hypothetical protein [Gimesia maris]|uniref:hypothetical protein n=1 Tax=Gimesia maris TaxID=122 RepID=UPI003A9442A0